MMRNNFLGKVLGIIMIAAIGFSFVNQSHAQVSSDEWDTKLNIVSEWWTLTVKTFWINFGTVAPSSSARLLTGTISGNNGYITTEDTLAGLNRYVTASASNMVKSWAASIIIANWNLTMTSFWWAAAVTTLSWLSTTEIVGVANSGVNFSGTNNYSIIQRTSFASGIIWKYGIIPTFKLNLPWYTPIGTYLGDFTVSLYTL